MLEQFKGYLAETAHIQAGDRDVRAEIAWVGDRNVHAEIAWTHRLDRKGVGLFFSLLFSPRPPSEPQLCRHGKGQGKTSLLILPQ